jgi:diguanylate cyclase
VYYNQNTEKASEIAAKALERIHAEGLSPTPDIYELWYVYYGELNPEVMHAIDILEQSEKKVTDERCLELHERFLSEASQNERVKQAGDRISQTIKNVGGLVVNVKNATNNYNDSLEEVTAKLADDEIDLVEAREVIGNVVSNTQDMMQQNALLEAELSKSTEVMRELQSDLEKVKKEALTDGLTHLANRKAFDAELIRVQSESIANESEFSLILMDIDHFKGFNDNFGHQVGDQVLRHVAKVLFEGVKGRDIVARYGGEEFALILPETDLKNAVMVAEHLRKAVASKEIINRNSNQMLGRITLSGGVAEFRDGESLEDFIGRADSALYSAKHNGRNQISAAKGV